MAGKHEPVQIVASAANGVVGDGITDVTEALQSVLDSAQSGDTVFLGAGNYVTSDTLELPAGVTLRVMGNFTDQVSIKG